MGDESELRGALQSKGNICLPSSPMAYKVEKWEEMLKNVSANRNSMTHTLSVNEMSKRKVCESTAIYFDDWYVPKQGERIEKNGIQRRDKIEMLK